MTDYNRRDALSIIRDRLSTRSNVLEDERLYNETRALSINEYENLLKANMTLFSNLKQLNTIDHEIISEHFILKFDYLQTLKTEILEEENLLREKDLIEKNYLDKLTRKIKQKIAYLNNFKENTKVLYMNTFESIEGVDKRESNMNSLKICAEAGVLTLPVESREKINTIDIRVLRGSNGIVGDAFTGENKLIQNVLNNSENIFQYSKLDEGPIRLQLDFVLTREKVINELVIKRKSQFENNNLIIEKILYKNIDENIVDVFELVNLEKQNFECNSNFEEEGINIIHLPAKAKKIELHLLSNEYVMKNNRKLFSIDLKQVEFFSNKFSNTGKIYFEEQTVLDGNSGYSVMLSESAYPKETDTIIKKIKLDDSGFVDCSDSRLILSNQINRYSIMYDVTRSESLDNIDLEEQLVQFVNIENIQKRFNSNFSPNEFIVENNGVNFKVYQPAIYKRNDDIRQANFLGVVLGKYNSYKLPINLNAIKVDTNDLIVLVGSEILTRYYSQNDLENDNTINKGYCISRNGESLYVKWNEAPDGALFDLSRSPNVRILLKPKKNELAEANNRILVKIDEDFDPSKNNIQLINNLKNQEFSEVLRLQSDGTGSELYLRLSKNNIIEESLEIINNESLIDRGDYRIESLNTGSRESYVHIVLTSEHPTVFLDNEFKVNYIYFETEEIKTYDFWQENEKLKGLAIPKGEVSTNRKKVAITRGNKSVYFGDIQLLKKDIVFDEGVFDPSKEMVEVPYMNGNYEFLNLGRIEKEIIPTIQRSTAGSISFSTHKHPYVGPGFKINVRRENEILSNVASNVNGNVVELFIEDEYSENYSIEYYYIKEPLKNTILYSVGHENHSMYFSEAAIGIGNISLRYVDLISKYHIIKYVDSFSVDKNEVKVNVENMLNQNSLIKFHWQTENYKYSFEEISNFYSPIIYEVKMEIS